MLRRIQSGAFAVAVVCGLLGLGTATGCTVLPSGEEVAAGPLHLLMIAIGAVSGLLFALRARAIDAERWRVVEDDGLTSGEREYAHAEAERERRSAGVAFLMAPLTVGFWLASHFRALDRGVATELLSLTPLVGFVLGLGVARLLLRGRPAPGPPS